jgi:hypothetical protein
MEHEPEDLGHGFPPAKVEALAGFGLSPEEIAHVLDADLEFLKSSCARELESGRIKANLRVAESLYRKATGEGRESVTAAIFWLKTRARWKETSSTSTDVRVSFATHEEILEQLR